jgi:hypothetical protein
VIVNKPLQYANFGFPGILYADREPVNKDIASFQYGVPLEG